MAKVMLMCSLLCQAACSAVGLDDVEVLAQASVHMRQSIGRSQPADPVDGAEVAKRVRASIDAALRGVGLLKDAGQKVEDWTAQASSLGSLGQEGQQHGMELGLASLEDAAEHRDRSYGVILHRDTAFVEEGSKLQVEFDHGCNSTDSLGSNDCTFYPNDKVHVRLHYRLTEPIGEGATFNVNVSTHLVGASAVIGQHLAGKAVKHFQTSLDDINVTCPLCGATCNLVVFGKEMSQVMPPCPLREGVEHNILDMDLKVPRTSGLKVSQSKVQGTVAVFRADGSQVMQGSGKVRIGKVHEAPCPQIKVLLNLCN